MIPYILTYLMIFSAIHFFGHFCMTMACGLGYRAITAMAAVLLTAVVITLWKASVCSEGKKEAIWGIFAGFFLWNFFGEFLAHERIVSLATPAAAMLLVPCILLVFSVFCRKAAPVGMRFALGHFACVWLLHAILANQAEAVKNHNQVLHAVTTPGAGLAFLLISLFMLFKTVRAKSDNARLAFLLSSFIFLWATMETLQVLAFLPDYTCCAHRTGGKVSGAHTGLTGKTVDKQIALIKKRYAWADPRAEEQAYALIKRLPSPHLIDDLTARLGQQMQHEGAKLLDEKLFCRVLEESFVQTSQFAFDQLLQVCIQQFKGTADSGRAAEHAGRPAGNSSRHGVMEKIAFIQERYAWKNTFTGDLAGYLLNKFSIQFLSGDEFIKKLDESLAQENSDTMDEEMFCRAMREHFAATCATVFEKFDEMPNRKGETL